MIRLTWILYSRGRIFFCVEFSNGSDGSFCAGPCQAAPPNLPLTSPNPQTSISTSTDSIHTYIQLVCVGFASAYSASPLFSSSRTFLLQLTAILPRVFSSVGALKRCGYSIASEDSRTYGVHTTRLSRWFNRDFREITSAALVTYIHEPTTIVTSPQQPNTMADSSTPTAGKLWGGRFTGTPVLPFFPCHCRV